ncbi:MAG: LysR family transcriptional regulator [Comamonadaceae bacterium]|nr:MAG: LysR family transcriptional regulator [Comamonadaceae bacterium]
MDTRRVSNFIAVVDMGSIARAAVALHIAQPALSAQMRQLEEMVGSPLLTRGAKGVVPTAAGLAFYDKGVDLLRVADGLRMVARDIAEDPEGKVVVGCPTSVGNMLAAPLVHAVVERHPRIELGLLESTSADLGEHLTQGRLDVAVLFADNLTMGMNHQRVLEEDLFIVGSRPMKEETALSALHGMALVMPARPNSVRLLLEKACAQRGIAPRILAEISSPHTMLQLARSGLGATVLPWSTLAAQRMDALYASRIVAPRLTRSIALATSAKVPETRRVQVVRDLVRDIMRGLVERSEWQGARVGRPARRAKRP